VYLLCSASVGHYALRVVIIRKIHSMVRRGVDEVAGGGRSPVHGSMSGWLIHVSKSRYHHLEPVNVQHSVSQPQSKSRYHHL